jgi:hypothetical protein
MLAMTVFFPLLARGASTLLLVGNLAVSFAPSPPLKDVLSAEAHRVQKYVRTVQTERLHLFGQAVPTDPLEALTSDRDTEDADNPGFAALVVCLMSFVVSLLLNVGVVSPALWLLGTRYAKERETKHRHQHRM